MKSQKKIITAFISVFLLLCCTPVFCKDYDERRVMFGENYTHIEKVSPDKIPVLKSNISALRSFAENFHDYPDFPITEASYFREKAGDTIFYRVIYEIQDLPFPAAVGFDKLQLFVLERGGKLFILDCSYLYKKTSGDGTVHSYTAYTYTNMTVVKNKNSFDLISHSTTSCVDYYDDPEEGGHGIEYSGYGEAEFYRLNDVLKAADSAKPQGSSIPKIKPESYCYAKCGKTLIDEDRPFMYTIQNAFDGNPSTSYVEDSEDDSISIEIGLTGARIKKIGIINGFAKNSQLYEANNRIKDFTLSDDDKPYSFTDTYSNQYTFFPVDNYAAVTLKTTSVYKGKSCTDTCISDIVIE